MNDTTTANIHEKCEKLRALECLWLYLLKNCATYLPVVGGVLVLLIILNITCIYWCVKRQVNRQLINIRRKDCNEREDRPISEAITCIYKTNNEEKDFAYDLASVAKVASNLSTSNEGCISEESNKRFIRPMSHNSDYDNVWTTTWTKLASPEDEYTQVEKVKKTAVTVSQDEEIYSKQKLDDLDTTVDDDELLNESIQKNGEPEEILSKNDNKSLQVHEPKMAKHEKSTVIIPKTDHKSERYVDKGNDFKCKTNDIQQREKGSSAGGCQKERTYSSETNKNVLCAPVLYTDEESEDRNTDNKSERNDVSSGQMRGTISHEEVCGGNERASSKTKNASGNESRCDHSKENDKNSKEKVSKGKKKCQKVKKVATTTDKRKSRKSYQSDDYCNVSINPEKTMNLGNLSREEANKRVDEATAILVANMNNVSLKTKL
ncbi:biorientation of chromosomes in cell division protein 1-like 1 [Saccostrea cucullata]|uniref:biorientation of chromosomes in cell division protein 1-like 1 n=1 Tax=Saccostrea cuccullata TaxID=36930 RepID=UPI002ED341BC